MLVGHTHTHPQAFYTRDDAVVVVGVVTVGAALALARALHVLLGRVRRVAVAMARSHERRSGAFGTKTRDGVTVRTRCSGACSAELAGGAVYIFVGKALQPSTGVMFAW